MKTPPPISFGILFCSCWIFLLLQLGRVWWTNPQYGYGLVVPILCGWLLWQRRGELSECFGGGDPSPSQRKMIILLIVIVVLSVLPMELLRQASPDLRSVGILSACGCIGLTLASLKILGCQKIPAVFWGSLLLVVTAVPWPTAIELALTQSLMRGIAGIATDCLNFFGILAVQRGNLVELSTGVVGVDEACSGVRSIQSCLMAGVALGQFLNLPRSRSIWVVGFGLILALIGNLLRTLTLTFLAAKNGPGALERFHDPAGWAILIGVTVVLYWMARRWERPPSDVRHFVFSEIPLWRLPKVAFLCGLGFTFFIFSQLWFVVHDARFPAQTEPLLVLRPSLEVKVERTPVPSAILNELNPHDGAYYTAQFPRVGAVSIYTFFWLPSAGDPIGFAHRPDICMVGTGWNLVADVKDMTISIDGQEVVWHLFTLQRNNERILQAWGIWRDGAEQKLNFSRGLPQMLSYHFQIWQYIWQGKRTTNTEVISVALDGRSGNEKDLREVIQKLFARNSASR